MMWLIGGKLGAILIFTLLSGSEGRRAEQGRGCAFLPSTWQSPRRECGARPSPFIEAGTRIRGCRSGHRLHCCQMAMGRLVQGCGKRRVAIVGGGLAGLSVAYHLLNMTRTTGSPSLSITIMDEFDVGEGGASGVMAGILHPLTPRGKEIWMGESGMKASLRLIEAASMYSERPLLPPWAKGNGVVRMVTQDKQEQDYSKAAAIMPDLVEMVRVQDVKYLQGVSDSIVNGLRVKDGCAVRGADYTKALFRACENMGQIAWENARVQSISSVHEQGYDVIVIAAGAACTHIAELCDKIPMKCVRSQNIEYVKRPGSPEPREDLGAPIISGIYLVPLEGPDGVRYLIGGASQEHDDVFCRESNLARAMSELHEPLSGVFRPIKEGKWIPSRARAGVKCLPPRQPEGSIPCVARLKNLTNHASTWLFTGLGARGLIHHAVLGELLAQAIVHDDESLLPSVTRRFQV